MQENEISVPDNPQQTETHTLQAMSFTEILDGMFSLYRKHFPLFFRIVSVYFILSFVLDIIMQFLYGSQIDENIAASLENIAASLIKILVTFLIAILVSGALYYATAELLLGRTITPNAAYNQSLNKYFPMLGCFFISLFVCSGLAITCIGIPFSIFFTVRWGVCTLPILIEDKSTMGALRRSGELVKGMWWRVFGIYSAMMTIYIMIQLILIISIGYLFYLFLARNDTPTNILKMIILVLDSTSDNIGWGLYLIQIFVTTGLNAITLPIITSGFTLLYFDLRVRKEAFDLELQAKQQQDINEHQS